MGRRVEREDKVWMEREYGGEESRVRGVECGESDGVREEGKIKESRVRWREYGGWEGW